MANTQVATRKPKQEMAPATGQPLTLRQQIDALKPEFEKTLPSNIPADHFIRTVQTALQLNPDLVQCTPRSLFAACMKAASDGLILDGREAALVIRNVKIKVQGQPDRWEKTATYMPMVQGLMKLARNSGEISSITTQVVYDNDLFTYVLGDDERIEHRPAPLNEDHGNPIAVYAIVKLKDGTVVREVMRAKQVLAIGAQGQNAFQYSPDSGKNFAEWWRKTAIRRITKYIPRSSDAVGKFTAAAEQIDGDFDFNQDPPPAAPAGKKRGGAAAALKDVTPKVDRAGDQQDDAPDLPESPPDEAYDQDMQPEDKTDDDDI